MQKRRRGMPETNVGMPNSANKSRMNSTQRIPTCTYLTNNVTPHSQSWLFRLGLKFLYYYYIWQFRQDYNSNYPGLQCRYQRLHSACSARHHETYQSYRITHQLCYAPPEPSPIIKVKEPSINGSAVVSSVDPVPSSPTEMNLNHHCNRSTHLHPHTHLPPKAS